MKKISHIQTQQRKITELVTNKFKKYYLSGGTALSFHFSHRFSEDLDFFSQKYDRKEPDMIMSFISEQTGFNFRMEAEEDKPEQVPMKVYSLELKEDCLLKIAFICDFEENIGKIENGLHSVDDIYHRKISAAAGTIQKQDASGRSIHTGRQSAKDFYDLYYLSRYYTPLPEFFLEHFARDRAEDLVAWHRRFNRLNLKTELLDLVPEVDTAEVIKHMDAELLKNLPEKLLS